MSLSGLAKRLIHYPDKLNWVCCDLGKTTRLPNVYFHPSVWLPVDKVPLGVMKGPILALPGPTGYDRRVGAAAGGWVLGDGSRCQRSK